MNNSYINYMTSKESAKSIFNRLEIVWNTKHKDNIQVKFSIPISNDKKWWQFYKKDTQKIFIEIIDSPSK